MKQFIAMTVCAVVLLGTSIAEAKQKTYDIDKSHTSILFFISHGGFSKMVGEFTDYEAILALDMDDPTKSAFSVILEPKNIDTGHDGLNTKLLGEDWFFTEKFPKMVYIANEIVKTGEKTADINGILNMRGVARPLILHATFNKSGEFYGSHRAGFTLKGEMLRSEWGMDHAIPNVGDKIEILIEAEAVERDVTPLRAVKE
jgi:polyisoprenoid-binding protein YceI